MPVRYQCDNPSPRDVILEGFFHVGPGYFPETGVLAPVQRMGGAGAQRAIPPLVEREVEPERPCMPGEILPGVGLEIGCDKGGEIIARDVRHQPGATLLGVGLLECPEQGQQTAPVISSGVPDQGLLPVMEYAALEKGIAGGQLAPTLHIATDRHIAHRAHDRRTGVGKVEMNARATAEMGLAVPSVFEFDEVHVPAQPHQAPGLGRILPVQGRRPLTPTCACRGIGVYLEVRKD